MLYSNSLAKLTWLFRVIYYIYIHWSSLSGKCKWKPHCIMDQSFLIPGTGAVWVKGRVRKYLVTLSWGTKILCQILWCTKLLWYNQDIAIYLYSAWSSTFDIKVWYFKLYIAYALLNRALFLVNVTWNLLLLFTHCTWLRPMDFKT